jgi:hypothetical protein
MCVSHTWCVCVEGNSTCQATAWSCMCVLRELRGGCKVLSSKCTLLGAGHVRNHYVFVFCFDRCCMVVLKGPNWQLVKSWHRTQPWLHAVCSCIRLGAWLRSVVRLKSLNPIHGHTPFGRSCVSPAPCSRVSPRSESNHPGSSCYDTCACICRQCTDRACFWFWCMPCRLVD